jgi:hypothetical protein
MLGDVIGRLSVRRPGSETNGRSAVLKARQKLGK